MSKWKEITVNDPPVGSICLVKGIAIGDYGYSDDERRIFRCRILHHPIVHGKLELRVEVLESTPRYWSGFNVCNSCGCKWLHRTDPNAFAKELIDNWMDSQNNRKKAEKDLYTALDEKP